MARWYRTGTVSVTNGSKIVTGSGTNLKDAIGAPKAGDAFSVDGEKWYEIDRIDNNSQLVLFKAYTGTTQSGISYEILRASSQSEISSLSADVTALVAKKEQFIDQFDTFGTSTNDTETFTDRFGNQRQVKTLYKHEQDVEGVKAQAESLVGSVVLPTKADFEARHEGKYAGAGFVEWGNHYIDSVWDAVNEGIWAAQGNFPYSNYVNSFFLGRNSSGDTLHGNSKTSHPIVYLSNAVFKYIGTAFPGERNLMKFPPAPDGRDKKDGSGRFSSIAEAESAGGSSLSLSSLMPRDFLYARTPRHSVNDHNVTQSGFMFPYANRQYGQTVADGVTTDGTQPAHFYQSGIFASDDTTVGNTISHSKLLANPKLMADKWQQLYADENGDIRQKDIQARVRRTENTLPRNWTTQDIMTALGLNFDGAKKEFYRTEDGVEYSIKPISFVQRRNTGAYHPAYNIAGSKSFHFSDGTGANKWRSNSANKGLIASKVSDCFNAGPDYSTHFVYLYSGRVEDTNSWQKGREDEACYDAIYASDILDLRMSAHKSSPRQVVENEIRRALNGDVRGWEATPFTKVYSQTFDGSTGSGWVNGIYTGHNAYGNTVSLRYYGWGLKRPNNGDYIQGQDDKFYKVVYNDGANSVQISVPESEDSSVVAWLQNKAANSQPIYTVHNEQKNYFQCNPLITEIITNIDVLESTFSDGVSGVWNATLSNNTPVFRKFTKKAISYSGRSFTHDNGSSWNSDTATSVSPVNDLNGYSGTHAAETLILSHYRARANFTSKAQLFRPETYPNLVWASNSHTTQHGSILCQSLLGKIPTASPPLPYPLHDIKKITTLPNVGSNNSTFVGDRQELIHEPLKLAPIADSPAFKVAPYAINVGGLLTVQILGQEVLYDLSMDVGDEAINIDPTVTQTYAKGNYYKFTSGIWRGTVFRCVVNYTSGIVDHETSVFHELSNGDLMRTSSGTVHFVRWNGLGFGDTSSFNVNHSERIITDNNEKEVLAVTHNMNTQYWFTEGM